MNPLDIFRNPVLSDRVIRRYIRRGKLIVGDVKDHQIQPNSVDLTLADTVRIMKPNAKDLNGKAYVDPKMKIDYKLELFNNNRIGKQLRLIGEPKWYRLEPNEFCLMSSREIIDLPNGILAFVQGRSSVARLSVQTEQAGLIDAGFRGTITFEVINQSKYPIILYEGMRIAQIYFLKAMRSGRTYGSDGIQSKYYEQKGPKGSNIYKDIEMETWNHTYLSEI